MSCKCKDKENCCFNCCKEKELVQDKLCCDFEVTGPLAAAPAQIYSVDPSAACGGFVASGMIKNCGSLPFTVIFQNAVPVGGGAGTPVRTIIVPAGGCTTFTARNFEAIGVFGALATDNLVGEICITPRYRVG